MSAERPRTAEGGWESLKVDELEGELEARGLPKSGKKDELIARLEDDEAAQAEAEEPAAGGRAEEAAEARARRREADEEPRPTPPTRRRGRGRGGRRPSRAAAAPPRPRPAARKRPRRDARRRPRRRARAKYVRSAPRKARLVMDHIRGKRVEQAQAILTTRRARVPADILKLLNSAVANAESAYELGADELRVARAFVDEGPTIKRYRPRALGRATRINKRTSHMTIELTTEGNGR